MGLKYVWCVLNSNRLCSLISIIGLALGLSCTTIIAKQINQELYTDSFHTGIDQICCLMSRESPEDRYALTGYWTTDFLYRDYPFVDVAVNIRSYQEAEITCNDHIFNVDILVVDSTFGKVFTFPMVAGNLQRVLSAPEQIVITEKLAERLFGQSYPVGKTLVYWGFTYKIAGVLKNLPTNSSFTFDALVPMREEYRTRMASSWVKVKKGINYSAVNMPQNTRFYPFKELYFNETVDKALLATLRTGSEHTLWILGWIGLIIFVISVFNYINIYQVTLLKRSREFAVKRVLGADNRILFRNFWYENLGIVFIAILLAIGLAYSFSGFLFREMNFYLIIDWKFDLLFVGGLIVLLPIGLALGAWVKYRKVNPGDAMKSSYMGHGSGWMRNLLLSGQYIMTTLMIIVALYFIRQLDFMLDQDIGLRQENIVQVPMLHNVRYAIENDQPEIMEKHWIDYKYIWNEINENTDLQYVCQGDFPLNFWQHAWRDPKSGMDFVSCACKAVVPEYMSLFGLELKEGCFFNHELDLYNQHGVVINETALKFFQIKDWRNTQLESESWGKYKIIGVVKDFRFEHIAKIVQPLIMIYSASNEAPFLMHIRKGRENAALNFLHQLHDKINPETEFSYHFFDDEIRKLYEKDKQTVTLFSVFTLLAVLISAFGLFGFSVFDMQQRYREIALRKVNGATLGEIIFKLSRSFLLLVLFSFLIACPLAFWIILKYMEYFSLTAPLTIGLFVIAILITIGITFLTLIGQSFKAVSENPVKALKNE